MNIEPCNNTKLIGYNDLLLDLKDLYNKKALPNKIIFSGQSGIGKATLSYHLCNCGHWHCRCDFNEHFRTG